MQDALGDRMKASYENRYRVLLPRRTYIVVRVDGKAFHTYTRHCERPFDAGLAADMDATAKALCEESQGAKLAFVQSDEISLLLTDFEKPESEAWFDNNLQKICSLTASIATVTFNAARIARNSSNVAAAHFDSRVFVIPDPVEVENYFIWRQQDATRNSILMTAAANFSPKQCHGKNCSELQELLFHEKGINWNDMPVGFKRGRVIVKCEGERPVRYVDKRTREEKSTVAYRTWWEATEPPIFTQCREYLTARIPRAWDK